MMWKTRSREYTREEKEKETARFGNLENVLMKSRKTKKTKAEGNLKCL